MAKTPAERKRAQRNRDRANALKAQSIKLSLTLYPGTQEALNRICAAGGFEEPQEALTLLIHNLDALAKRDLSRFHEMTKAPRHE